MTSHKIQTTHSAIQEINSQVTQFPGKYKDKICNEHLTRGLLRSEEPVIFAPFRKPRQKYKCVQKLAICQFLCGICGKVAPNFFRVFPRTQ